MVRHNNKRCDLLEITAERENGQHFVFGFYSQDLDLEIGVPKQYRNRLVVRTSSGDVKLFLTEAAQFRLEARASSGDIRCEFPVTLARKSEESLWKRVKDSFVSIYTLLPQITVAGDPEP